ncbi:MAG: permease-like cell division protein FtsX [Thermodesulfovibrio sp.]|nr:permease-like cell division protein FtsX [Thermodesulfovibrio sp.]
MKRHIQSAIKDIWNNRWSTFLSVLTVAVCFFIITGISILLYNLEIFTKKLTTKAAVVIFLKDSITEEQTNYLMDQIKKMGVFSKLQYISKDMALKEMKDIMEPSLVELIGYNPLYNTIEAYLKDEALTTVEDTVNKIKSLQFVDDVYYPANIITGLKIIRVTLWNFGIGIFILLTVSVLFIVYSTIRSFYWKKTEEIEILKLLGATPSYIRLPFLIEGAIIGLIGSMFSKLFIFIVFLLLQTRHIYEFIPVLTQIVIPLEIFYMLPIFGILSGVVSSFLSVGKIKYQ